MPHFFVCMYLLRITVVGRCLIHQFVDQTKAKTERIVERDTMQCTEVRFTSFLSGVFTTMVVINPPERKLAKRTSMHCAEKNSGKGVSNSQKRTVVF